MGKLLLLFGAGFIGLLLRYIILGKFEIEQLLSLLLFVLGAMIALGIDHFHKKKDREMPLQVNTDPNIQSILVTSIADRASTAEKVIVEQGQEIAVFHRTFPSLWKRFVANAVMESSRYLNIILHMTDGTDIEIQETKTNETKIKANTHWEITVDGVKRGEIRSDVSWKNTKKFKEKMLLIYDDHAFHYSSNSLESATIITNERQHKIAEGERLKRAIYKLEIEDGCDPLQKTFLFMGFVVFNYFNKQ